MADDSTAGPALEGRRAYSTRAHLMALSLVVLLPILAALSFVSNLLLQAERSRLENEAMTIARSVGAAIGSEMAGAIETLQTLTLTNSLHAGDFAAFHRLAVRVAELHNVNITLRDRQSRQVVNSSIPWGDPLPDSSRLQAADAEVLRTGAPAVSNYFRSILDQRPFTAVVVPVRRDGEIVYLLSMAREVHRIQQKMNWTLPEGWSVTLMDREGVAVANSVRPDAHGARTPFAPNLPNLSADTFWRGAGADGQPAVAALHRTSFGWAVAVGGPTESFNQALWRTVRSIALGVLGLVVLALVAGSIIARRMIEPMGVLARMADRMGRGEPVALTRFGNREANAVAQSFSAAAIGLRERERALRESEARYRNALRVGRIGAWETDFVRKTRTWSDEGMALFGLSLPGGKGIVGGPDDEWRAAVDALNPGLADDIYATLAKGDVLHTEYRIKGANGASVWLLAHAEVVDRQPDGAPARLISVVADITERRRMEERLRVSEARFRGVQETSVDGFMILRSVRDAANAIVDFRWLYVNEAAARMVGRPREAFIGRQLLVEMPGNRTDGLFDAYRHLVETGEPLTREVSYRHEGMNVYLRIVAARIDDGFAVTFADLSERRRFEQQLQESEERLGLALKAGDLGVQDYDPRSGTMVWDEKARAIWGFPPGTAINYDAFMERVHESDRFSLQSRLDAVLSGEGDRIFTCEYRVINRQDQTIRWVSARAVATIEDGMATRLVGTVLDITDRRLAEEHRAVLIHELNHRVKNTLAVIQGLANQTLRHHITADVHEGFTARLHSLANAYDILTAEHWQGAALQDVVERALKPFRLGEGRIRISGPLARVGPQATLALSMALHELATNAVKYGALSNHSGVIDIGWSFTPAAGASRLVLRWQESGGPPVVKPARHGFGTRLITRGLSHDLSAEVEYAAEGLICTITIALQQEGMAQPAPEPQTHARERGDAPGAVRQTAATDAANA